ncbi:MAG: PEP-CTERM sorting domain-containing protein [Pirellulales bacterium]|nr:PEP-CTERM sorting domain-containing protein [Pirellulales bacterium]
MKRKQKMARTVCAIAAGLGGAQSLEAAVQHQNVDVDIPMDVGDYQVDINGDFVREFDIQVFDTITKVADFSEGGSPTGAFVALDNDGLTANLPQGASIDPTLLYGVPTHDRLSGTTTDEFDGNFQVSDGPGYIGVQFLIEGQTHYGYVGYEGTGAEGSANGKVFSLGYDDVPNTLILAGAGATTGLGADKDDDGDVDGNDFLLIQQGLGGEYDADDFTQWQSEFGQVSGVEAAVNAVPEPSALVLLAAGAAGVAAYRRQRQDS